MPKRAGITYGYEEKVIPYEEALRAVGLEPVRLHANNPYSLDGLDGLVVSGGTDVDPARYGQEPHPATDKPDGDRDTMETKLLHESLKRDMPVLAICRGMQLFNVIHEGTLHQHIDNLATHRVRTTHKAHLIRIIPHTRLEEILGAPEAEVNSRHHQAVDRVGDGLIVTASAPDGVIEALERPDRRFAIAVQWHPEDCISFRNSDHKLFEAFAKALER